LLQQDGGVGDPEGGTQVMPYLRHCFRFNTGSNNTAELWDYGGGGATSGDVAGATNVPGPWSQYNGTSAVPLNKTFQGYLDVTNATTDAAANEGWFNNYTQAPDAPCLYTTSLRKTSSSLPLKSLAQVSVDRALAPRYLLSEPRTSGSSSRSQRSLWRRGQVPGRYPRLTTATTATTTRAAQTTTPRGISTTRSHSPSLSGPRRLQAPPTRGTYTSRSLRWGQLRLTTTPSTLA